MTQPAIYNRWGEQILEVVIPVRIAVVSLLLLTSIFAAQAKTKRKQELPDVVLNARRVVVVIRPDAGEPVTNPTANRTAQDVVEQALSKWGRFEAILDAKTADLVIAVRKGHAGGPTISNSPADDRPVIFQPSGGGVRVGAQQGRLTDLTNPGLARRIEARTSKMRLVRQKTSLKCIWVALTIHWMHRPSGDTAAKTH
jgi:hypothetical protein